MVLASAPRTDEAASEVKGLPEDVLQWEYDPAFVAAYWQRRCDECDASLLLLTLSWLRCPPAAFVCRHLQALGYQGLTPDCGFCDHVMDAQYDLCISALLGCARW